MVPPHGVDARSRASAVHVVVILASLQVREASGESFPESFVGMTRVQALGIATIKSLPSPFASSVVAAIECPCRYVANPTPLTMPPM